MLGTRYVRIHGVSTCTWAKRYNIDPFSVDCPGCGARKETTIPIADGPLRGLLAPPCPCGDTSRTYALVAGPGHGDLLWLLQNVRL